MLAPDHEMEPLALRLDLPVLREGDLAAGELDISDVSKDSTSSCKNGHRL